MIPTNLRRTTSVQTPEDNDSYVFTTKPFVEPEMLNTSVVSSREERNPWGSISQSTNPPLRNSVGQFWIRIPQGSSTPRPSYAIITDTNTLDLSAREPDIYQDLDSEELEYDTYPDGLLPIESSASGAVPRVVRGWDSVDLMRKRVMSKFKKTE